MKIGSVDSVRRRKISRAARRPSYGRSFKMRNRLFGLKGGLGVMLVFSSTLSAQTVAQQGTARAQPPKMAAHMPDLSGLWAPRPDGIRINTWDSSDPFGQKPELAPMTPWAAAKWNEARPPFEAKQTFEGINDPVQRYCDPPGITRIWMYPWEFTMIQTTKMVYILYEFTRVWRSVAMNQEHPKDPDATWMGDSVGRYEGDTFVIDTIGFNY